MAMTAKKKAISKKAKRAARNAANAANIKEVQLTPSAKPSGSGTQLVSIKASAMSVDVGPKVVMSLAKAYEDERKANEMLSGVNNRRYDLLAQMTQAIVKAGENDDSINLALVFEEGKEKDKNVLYDQVGLALGTRTIVTVGKGDKVAKRIAYAPSVAKFFPQPGENKDDPKIKAKDTFRSNFSHQVKKCIQAAAAIIEKGIEIETDRSTGTLRISGPEVMKKFGAESVLLNEKKKQDVENPKKGEAEVIELKDRPSFTAVAAMAAGGAAVKRGTNTRGTKVETPEAACVALCQALVKALPKVKTHTEPLKEAVKSLSNALDKAGLLEA